MGTIRINEDRTDDDEDTQKDKKNDFRIRGMRARKAGVECDYRETIINREMHCCWIVAGQSATVEVVRVICLVRHGAR